MEKLLGVKRNQWFRNNVLHFHRQQKPTRVKMNINNYMEYRHIGDQNPIQDFPRAIILAWVGCSVVSSELSSPMYGAATSSPFSASAITLSQGSLQGKSHS